MGHDAIVVGSGMAGLTAAAYLSRAGLSTLVLEKEAGIGGLVNSFTRGGFGFDGGIRAVENSGIVLPMLRQLGIEVEFLPSTVSVGFGKDVVRLGSRESLAEYGRLVARMFPGREGEVRAVIDEVARVMEYMDVLYGIDNPLFLDLKNDPGYVFGTILPWMVRYIRTMPKVAKLMMPVEERLAELTDSQPLIDMFAQHFFRATPAYFALSYFSLYLDYKYPKGGTGVLPAALERYVLEHGGEILRGTEAVGVDPAARTVTDAAGRVHEYGHLVWAADSRALYRILDLGSSRLAPETIRAILAQAALVADKRGGDSILTLNLAVDLPPSYFSGIASAHFFHTPRMEGLSSLGPAPLGAADALFAWASHYLDLTTYEISFPVLRDPSLAPEGKTGLIVSTLMDFDAVRRVRDAGRYGEFKEFCADRIVAALDASIFPGLAGKVLDRFVSTPLTIESVTGNTDGAITGWAFTNGVMPAVHSLPRVASSVLTPIPRVFQAGQWTFSPSGLPISILTGKLAADRIVSESKKRSRRGR